jgi:hypothetical protein
MKIMKYAYSPLSVRRILGELANDCGITNLRRYNNAELHSRRGAQDYRDPVLVTITVERLPRVKRPKPKRPSVPARAAGGHATAAIMSPAQRQERARLGGIARRAKAVSKFTGSTS